MKTYVAVVDSGSFASAATRLDVSRAMVSKQVQKLEEHLGTRLLNRTTYSLSGGGGAEWRLESANEHATVPVAGPMKADNGDIIRLAAVAGAGIAFQPHFIIGDDIAAGRLVQVLPEWRSAEMGIYAVYPSRKHLSAKVRTFVDFLVAALV